MERRKTVTATVHAIRALGLSCGWSALYREYRVTLRNVPPARAEANAYYTNDADDAIATAQHMLRHTSCSTDLDLTNSAN